MRCRDRNAAQRGVSLVETMIALVMIVVGLAAMQRLFPQGQAIGRQALERTRATLLARGQLEQLRVRGFDSLAAAAKTADAAPAPFLDSRQQTIFPRFRWRADVKPYAADLLQVEMHVTWPWPRQTSRVSLVTYVSKR